MIALAMGATGVLIFGFSAWVGPRLQRWSELQGIERIEGRTRLPMRQQLQIVGIICVLGPTAVIAGLLGGQEGSLFIALGGALFMAMMAAVIILSVRYSREAKCRHAEQGPPEPPADLEAYREQPPLPMGVRRLVRCVLPALTLKGSRAVGASVALPPVVIGMAIAGEAHPLVALAATFGPLALLALVWRKLNPEERPTRGPCGPPTRGTTD